MEDHPGQETVVSAIEDSPLDVGEKMELLLVSTGTKPATDFTRYSEDWSEPGSGKPIDEPGMTSLVELLDRSGIQYEVLPEQTVNVDSEHEFPKRKEQKVLVGKDKESLELLKKAFLQDDPELFGRAYGFPETAIQAYICGQTFNPNNLPQNVRQSEAYVFGRFAYSTDHWQDELKTAQRWSDSIKNVSPKIYQLSLSEFHEAKPGFETTDEPNLNA